MPQKNLQAPVTGRLKSFWGDWVPLRLAEGTRFERAARYGDLFLPIVVATTVALLFQSLTGVLAEGLWMHLLVGALIGLAFVICNAGAGLYRRGAVADFERQLRSGVISWIVVWLAAGLAAGLMGNGVATFQGALLSAVLGLPVLAATRALLAQATPVAMRRNRKRVGLLWIGDAPDFGRNFRTHFTIACGRALVTDDKFEFQPEQVCDFVRAAQAAGIDRVFVSLQPEAMRSLQTIVPLLRTLRVPITLAGDTWTGNTWSGDTWPENVRGRFVKIAPGVQGFELDKRRHSRSDIAIKRGLDIVVAVGALPFLVLLIAIVAVAIKLDSRGPVIFRQRRLGLDNRPFVIFKFRSMRVMEDGGVVRQATKGDDRVTRVGRILRASSLDELPNLFNVLRGDMAIVGPRPHAIAHDEHFEPLIEDYALRRSVKPGLTGWAQINGHRGETPSVDCMRERVQYDIWYVMNWTAWLDVKILARTFLALLRNKNVY